MLKLDDNLCLRTGRSFVSALNIEALVFEAFSDNDTNIGVIPIVK